MIKKISEVIYNLGIRPADTVLLHIDTDILKPKSIKQKEHCNNILESIFYVLGDKGTLVTPSFNYDFCKTGIFDINKSPSQVGYFANFIINKSESIRSSHPIFSFVAVGKNASKLMNDIPPDSFGENSVFDKLYSYKAKGLFLNLPIRNVDGPPSTLIHYIEQKFGVDYRYIKEFPGKVINNGQEHNDIYLYNVRNYDLDIRTDNVKLYNNALKAGCMRTYMIDYKYPISVCEIHQIVSLGLKMLQNNKYAMLEKNPYE